MNWEIEVDGKTLDEKFDSEDKASQHAANLRGQDWSRKIDVRPAGGAERPKSPDRTLDLNRGLAVPVLTGKVETTDATPTKTTDRDRK